MFLLSNVGIYKTIQIKIVIHTIIKVQSKKIAWKVTLVLIGNSSGCNKDDLTIFTSKDR